MITQAILYYVGKGIFSLNGKPGLTVGRLTRSEGGKLEVENERDPAGGSLWHESERVTGHQPIHLSEPASYQASSAGGLGSIK